MTRKCPVCSTKFIPNKEFQTYCNDICRKQMYEMKFIYTIFKQKYYRHGSELILKQESRRKTPLTPLLLIKQLEKEVSNEGM